MAPAHALPCFPPLRQDLANCRAKTASGSSVAALAVAAVPAGPDPTSPQGRAVEAPSGPPVVDRRRTVRGHAAAVAEEGAHGAGPPQHRTEIVSAPGEFR